MNLWISIAEELGDLVKRGAHLIIRTAKYREKICMRL